MALEFPRGKMTYMLAYADGTLHRSAGAVASDRHVLAMSDLSEKR